MKHWYIYFWYEKNTNEINVQFNRYTRKDYSMLASLKGLYDTIKSIWRPNERNMTQTLTSVVCDPQFYHKDFNGKVVAQHSTENPWNDWNSESEPYLNMVMKEDIVSLLDNTASLWSDLEKRKSDLKGGCQS